MLRDAGVRSKLFAVLAIPTILLMVATAWLVGGQVQSATRAGQVEALTDVAIQVNNVVHSLQQERSATLSYLQSPIAGNRKAMTGQRQYTDTQLRILKDKVAASPLDQMSESIRAAAQRSTAAHGELVGARRSIDARRFYSTETDVFYGKVIATDLQLPGALATSATPQLAQRLQAYAALSSTIEYASHERDLVEIAYLEGNLNESEFAQASALVAQQRQSLQDFQRAAPAQLFRVLDNRLAKSDVYTVDQSRRHLTDLLKGRDPDVGGSVEWVGAANSRISPMVAVEHILVADIADTAASTKSAERRQAAIFGTAALFGLALAVLLALALAQRITRPLRRLTVAAGEIGEELPHMVERMQTPGEGPGVVVEPIVIESRDEIGRLAEAFNTVNDVTVRVAKEQAALRASIAEMFVNVARRNQLLLGRQLAQLDQMEAREEDPDVLQNLFRLDHLATRMRRNAESLLVLAGIDSTRRLRRALPLSDVIRTAVGEIEAYERIDLSMTEDPQVSGRHALTIAHLLAELLENATHFSNPGTRVVVAAAVTGHGVDITVTDYGLGMSGQEIAEANQHIAHPPVAEIAVSQRLGLFVVGRLAARLGATAELRRGRSAGIVVTVGLPATIFEGMYVEPPVEVADPTEVADTTDMVSVDFIADAPVDGPVDVTDSGAAADADADFVTTEPPTARSSRRRSRTTRRSAGAALDASVTDVPEPAPAPVESSLEDTVLIEAVPLADEDVPASASVETGDEPVAVEPVAEEPVAEETVTDETLTDETLAHETLADEPVAEQTPIDEPVAEQTPIDEPVAEKLAPGRRRGLFARRRAEAQDDPSPTAPAIESAVDGELEHSDLSASAVSDAAADLFARDASPDPTDAPEPTAEDETVDVVDEAAAADLEPRPRRRGLFGRRDRVATPLAATDTELVADSEATDAQSAARVTDEPVRELVAELIAVPTVEAPESTGLDETVDHAEAGDENATEAPAAPEAVEPRAERGRGRFGRRRHREPAPVEDAAPTAAARPVEAAQPDPFAAVRPEPFPAAEPIAAPAQPFVFASAIDILPGKPIRSRGRHATAPAPIPVAPATAAPAVAAPAVAPPAAVEAPVAPPTPTHPAPTPTPWAAPVPAEAEAHGTPGLPYDGGQPAVDVPEQAPRATQVPVVPAIPPAPAPAMSSVGAASGPPRQATAAAPSPTAAPLLPTRAPREPVAQVAAAPAPSADLDQLARNADLHSSALSELRGLYEPSFTPAVVPVATEPGNLARRTPRAAPDVTATDNPPAEPPARNRNAAEVRGMLSGFRAGVERGRTTPTPAEAEPTDPTS